MTDKFDPIRILLIDDNPGGFPRAKGFDTAVPEMDFEYRDCFEFRWVATPQEAREMRDLSWLIEQHDPLLLGREGWVPEILAIDYTLLQYSETGTVSQRVQNDDLCTSLSPLPSLRRCADACGICVEEVPSFDRQPAAGSEYWGCFIGGLLINTFASHPCAPVTITRYTQSTLKSEGIDAAFFEWMMSVQSSGLLHAAGDREDVAQNWDYVIRTGVAHLRQRLAALVKAGMLQASLDDLLAISGGEPHPVVTVTTRYGRRRYPIDGLFIDTPQEHRSAAASAWAHDLIQTAMTDMDDNSSEQMLSDVRQGKVLADHLWDAYCDDELFGRRTRLSELLGRQSGKTRDKSPLSKDETKVLSDLVEYFAIPDPDRANPTCTRNYVELRHADFDERARRWAVLMIIVRLLHDRYCAVDVARRILGIAPEKQQPDFALDSPISPADIYLALFPAPQTPVVLPWHAEKSDPAGSWSRYIRELGIDLKQVLDGCGPSAPSRGERSILRMFAESVGAENDDWGPADWQRDRLTQQVLFGAKEMMQ